MKTTPAPTIGQGLTLSQAQAEAEAVWQDTHDKPAARTGITEWHWRNGGNMHPKYLEARKALARAHAAVFNATTPKP